MSQKKVKISDLDFNNIGNWPRNHKIGFCVLVGLLILLLAYFLSIKGKREELQGLERQESDLRRDFEDKAGRAANLEPLKQQLAQMEQVLQQMLRQLPSKTEMPDLIVDISQTALSSGLANELFQPGPETPKEFYAEKPIALRRGFVAARGDPDHARYFAQTPGHQRPDHRQQRAGAFRNGQDLSVPGRRGNRGAGEESCRSGQGGGRCDTSSSAGHRR